MPVVRPLDRLSRGVKFATMGNRTFGMAEVVGTSSESIELAVSSAVERAGRTMKHIDWFEITQVRGYVKDGAVDHFQVSLKIGYRLEDV